MTGFVSTNEGKNLLCDFAGKKVGGLNHIKVSNLSRMKSMGKIGRGMPFTSHYAAI